MDPVGIEPTPLVLQTSVRTSYTKGPIVGHCGIEPHLLTERFYRPLITPVTEASQFDHSTGIEPASPPSTGSVVTIPLRTKLQQAFIGKLITHNRLLIDLKILAGILLATQNFVPRSRIELLPFPCKRNTLPLRQRGNFCTPTKNRTWIPILKSIVL